MKKIKINYDQVRDVLAMHLEAIGVIDHSEEVHITPFKLENNQLTVYINRRH